MRASISVENGGSARMHAKMIPQNIMGVQIQICPKKDCGVLLSWMMRATMSLAIGGPVRIHAQVMF